MNKKQVYQKKSKYSQIISRVFHLNHLLILFIKVHKKNNKLKNNMICKKIKIQAKKKFYLYLNLNKHLKT